jgi:nucleoside-triphosphatase THEP1
MPSAPPVTSGRPGLLIAVTGHAGEGKTGLLLQLAAHQLSLGQRVEGFAAIAGPRRAAGAGAEDYRLRIITTGQELPWATRDEKFNPPYRLEWQTFENLLDWAAALRPQTPLVILDEFAKFEAQGNGLMPLWPAIAAASPQIAVLAVRAGLVDRIEEKLGQRFDLQVSASAPDALAQLERACADFGEWTRIGLYGGAAGGAEMTVGTALHAANVPLGGLVMCSLQSAMMTFTGFGLTEPARVVWVPFISAGLKALSPAGNRLRPMLAIGVQGALYGTSVQVLGWNLAGVSLGGALVGAWAALQGFFLQYLLLGGDLIQACETVGTWLAQELHIAAPSLPVLVGAWTLFHALISGGVALTAWLLRAPPQALQKLIAQEMVRVPATNPAPQSKWKRIARDGLRWQFWLPLLIVGAIMIAGGHPWEAVARLVLRFVATTLVLLALLSLLRPARWAERLRRFGWWGPAVAFGGAVGRRGAER